MMLEEWAYTSEAQHAAAFRQDSITDSDRHASAVDPTFAKCRYTEPHTFDRRTFNRIVSGALDGLRSGRAGR